MGAWCKLWAQVKVWCIPDLSVLAEGLHSEAFMKKLPEQPELLAAVMFGGDLVDSAWLKRADEHHGISGDVTAPHWHVRGSTKKPLEICLPHTFSEEFPKLDRILREASADQSKRGNRSRWTVRFRRQDLRQQERSFMVCKNPEEAKKMAEARKSKKDSVKQQEKIVKELRVKNSNSLALGVNVARLKLLRVRLKKIPGTCISPAQLFQKIALMSELNDVRHPHEPLVRPLV
jgi:hypothetical protein